MRWAVALLALLGPNLAVLAQPAPNTICEIVVEGNEHISEAAIRAMIQSRVGEPFNEAKAKADAENILAMGYFRDVRYLPERTPKGIRLKFVVTENPVITGIVIEGNRSYDSETLLNLIETRPGQVLNERVFRRDAERIRELYAHHGYVADVVGAEVDKNGILHIHILEVEVEKIEIQGLKKTKPIVILREMRLKPGMVFNAGILGGDLARIYNLGLFEEVERDVREGSEPGKVVVVIKVKERKTGMLAGGVGYSSRYRLVGILNVTESNLGGMARRVEARAEFGKLRDSYEFSYYDPWLDKHRTSLSLSIYNRLITQDFYYWGTPTQVSTYFDERRKGFTISLSRPVGRRLRLSLEFRNEKVKRSAPYTAPGAIPNNALQALQFQRGRVVSWLLSAISDTRDRIFAPTQGSRNSFTVEIAGGPMGGPSFAKYVLDLRRYFPVAHKPTKKEILYGKARKEKTHVLAVRLLAGTASKGLPAYEAFFLGGADTHRGYDWYRFYGRNILVVNVEYRVPLAKDLYGVAFVDWGDAWKGRWAYQDDQGNVYTYQAEHEKFSPSFGYGVGIRVQTPLGPIRIDYGFGKEGPKTHFAIGQQF